MIIQPVAPRKPHELKAHGETRIDNYYWLRQREDPEVMKYLLAENQHLEEAMQDTKQLQESLFAELKGRIQEVDSTVPEKRGEFLYYQRTEAGKQYPIFCRRKDSMENPEEVLLDQNKLAEGRSFCSVSAVSVSPDGRKFAYSVDYGGDETYTIHIKNLEDDQLYSEEIPNTLGSVYYHTGVEWANDSETLFYATLDDSKRPFKLYRHKIGMDPSEDVLIFHEKDETFYLIFHKSRDDAYILTDHISTLTTEVRYLSADQPDGELTTLSPRRHGIEYSASHHKGKFLLLTNESAKNFKLVTAPVGESNPENWQEIIPHDPEVMLLGVDTFEDHIVVYERKGGLPQIRISNADIVSNVKYVNFPEPTYNYELESNHEFTTGKLRIKYSSLVTPHTVVDIHMEDGRWEVKKEEQVHGYDKSKYVCELIYAPARDGKQIPISISYRKDSRQDGGNPTLLHGYGAYGAVMEAEFNSNRVSLLDRGFVYAMAHIRGSSTLGREWYEDGKLKKKKNSFHDFIDCAEYLKQQGFTAKEKLAIYGVSAGGLLVGACMTMRPDLFKTVIAKVPFVDVVTTMSDPSIPLTTHEYDEWGNPEKKDQFEYMLSYSPYDNLKATEYPNLLLTAGFNDPRVPYWEPVKFSARLRDIKTDENLLLLKTNFDAGHAGSSGRYDFLKEVAFEYAFLLHSLE